MKLTPIKVRGKAGQKKAKDAPKLDREKEGKRKRSQGDTDGAYYSKGERQKRRRFKSRPPAAPIEDLPTEVLERILFMSRNLNLLRCSLRIGHRFSSASFLTELLEAAFAPTWDAWYSGEVDPTAWYAKSGEIPGDYLFQSDVLACPWINVTLLLEAQQKWYRRTGGWPGGRLGHHQGTVDTSRLHASGAFSSAEDVRTRFQADWERFRADCIDFSGSGDQRQTSGRRLIVLPATAVRVEVHPMVKIPERLLAGPLSWEMARLLFWLVRAGCCLRGAKGCSSWELTERGFDNIMALGDKDCGLVHLLLLAKLDAFVHWPSYLLLQKADEVAQRMRRQETRGEVSLHRSAKMILGHHQHLRASQDEYANSGPPVRWDETYGE